MTAPFGIARGMVPSFWTVYHGGSHAAQRDSDSAGIAVYLGLSLVMILSVYRRFFKLYMAAIALIQISSSIGTASIKSYAAIRMRSRKEVLSILANPCSWRILSDNVRYPRS